MSSTNRSTAKRDPLERYDTPEWAVHWLLDRLALEEPAVLLGALGTWMEPAVGAGNIVRACQSWFAAHGPEAPGHWWLNDIAPRLSAPLPWTARQGDFLALDAEAIPDADVGITNPAFSLALRFAERMTQHCLLTALLLRVNWLEGASAREPERAAFLRAHPPDVYVLPNRPPFEYPDEPVRRGTDSCAYAWMVWSGGLGTGRGEHGRGGWALLDETSREERRR